MFKRSLASAVTTTALAPGLAFAQGQSWEWDWGMHPLMFMWSAGGLVMMVMMLLFWVVVIVGLVVGVRWLVGQGRLTGRDEALEILRQRYARGEIDKQEFDARKRDIGCLIPRSLFKTARGIGSCGGGRACESAPGVPSNSVEDGARS